MHRRRHALRRAYRAVLAAIGAATVSTAPALSAQQPVAVPAAASAVAPLAFEHATVVDVRDGQLLRDQTVLVAANRIAAMGPTGRIRAPNDTRVIDARGKYLIPGLWDMHAHVDALANIAYPEYIAGGITGIREMAQRFPHGADSFRVWQREVMAGTRVGPRGIGPSTDVSECGEPSLGPGNTIVCSGIVNALKTPDGARRLIDSLKAAGEAFVKYHGSGGNRASFLAMLSEARRVGLPIVGHLPDSVTDIEVADSGFRSLEHLNTGNSRCWPASQPDPGAVERECGPLAAAYIRNEMWAVPTMVVHYYIVYNNDKEHVDARLRKGQDFLRELHRRGVRTFLTGTDCAEEELRRWGLKLLCHRGLSVLEELGFFVGAGFTPLEALQTATLNPAKFIRATDSLGTVEQGKLADLVLLDENPLTDIRNIMTIRAVVANGRYFDRAALDTLDPEGVKAAADYAARHPRQEP